MACSDTGCDSEGLVAAQDGTFCAPEGLTLTPNGKTLVGVMKSAGTAVQ